MENEPMLATEVLTASRARALSDGINTERKIDAINSFWCEHIDEITAIFKLINAAANDGKYKLIFMNKQYDDDQNNDKIDCALFILAELKGENKYVLRDLFVDNGYQFSVKSVGELETVSISW